MDKAASLQLLPSRLVCAILDYLSAVELGRCQQLSCRLQLPAPLLEYQWRRLYCRDHHQQQQQRPVLAAEKDVCCWQQAYKQQTVLDRRWRRGEYSLRVSKETYDSEFRSMSTATVDGQDLLVIGTQSGYLLLLNAKTKQLIRKERVSGAAIVRVVCARDIVFALNRLSNIYMARLPDLLLLSPAIETAGLRFFFTSMPQFTGSLRLKWWEIHTVLTNGHHVLAVQPSDSDVSLITLWSVDTRQQVFRKQYRTYNASVSWKRQTMYLCTVRRSGSFCLREYSLATGKCTGKRHSTAQLAYNYLVDDEQDVLIALLGAPFNELRVHCLSTLCLSKCVPLYTTTIPRGIRLRLEPIINASGRLLISATSDETSEEQVLVLDRTTLQLLFAVPSGKLKNSPDVTSHLIWAGATSDRRGIYAAYVEDEQSLFSLTIQSKWRVLSCEFTTEAEQHGIPVPRPNVCRRVLQFLGF